MTTQKLMLAALLACTFAPAYAEEPEQAAGQPRVERRIVTRQGEAMTFNFDELNAFPAGQGFRFEAFMHGKPIKNAPYSAQLVNERQQNLPDGNQIANKHTTASYRDSAGRTRQEVRDNNGEVRAVTIHDPVAGATYILHPQDKTATKVPTNPEAVRAAAEAARAAGEAARGAGAEAARAAGEAARGAAAAARAAAAAQREAMREQVEQMRREGKLPTVERRTGPNGEEIVIKRVERAGNGRGDGQNEVRVRIEQNMAMMDGARAAQLAPLAGAFGDSKWAAKATTKDLGTREMDGVKAEGKLRTYEIPAGEVGNRNPIVVSHESWYSPDLQITLYTKHSDPRTGDQIYRVEGLKREEPAAALFTIPSDYTVRDVMANLKNKAEPKAK